MGAKLNFSFIATILVMCIVQAIFTLVVDLNKNHSKAIAIVDPAIECVNKELGLIYRKNGEIAAAIERNADFKKAYSAKDRAAVAAIINTTFDRVGFDGYATIINDQGQIFFSSDAPGKFGYTSDGINSPLVRSAFGIPSAQGGTFASALCSLSCTKAYTLSSLVPIGINGKNQAVLAVSTPFSNELLLGMERKIKLTKDNLKEFEMAFYVMADAQVKACSANLQAMKPPPAFLASLNNAKGDILGETSKEKQADGFLWKNLPIRGPNGMNAMGQIIVCAPMANQLASFSLLALQLAIGAVAAIILALVFSAALSKRFNQSMWFLKQRAKDLAENKRDLPSLSVLNGDYLELAEMMDTALTNPRAMVLNLKQTVSKQEEELSERQRQIDAINSQLEMVNRQLTAHNRQSVDISNQVQTANKQAIQVQQKLDAVMQCSSEGFLLLDPYGSVLAANPTFLRWTGTDEREIFGKVCFDLVKKPGEPKDLHTMSFANTSGGPNDLINQFFPEGVVYHRFENKHTDVLMHLQPIVGEDGNIQGYIMVLRDKSLHAEVARLRGEIVTMLGDDIRSPLTTAESYWKNLQQQLPNMPPAVAQNLLEMHKTYENMMGMVDSYLMMYGGFVPPPVEQIPREQVSVTRLIGECLETVSQHARAQQIMLDYKTVTGLPTTSINKEIVRDIIINLLDKMISVTAPGGRVRAETTIKGKEIRLIISSSGPALQQIEIEDMFIGFIGGKHAEDTYQTRLNMYLARNNAERLGGRIWAESEAGRGTAIFLTLPVH